jgi:sugar phosphate isomerase/epimerase
MNMAVATSIFAHNGFDPFMTIEYAEENKIAAIQFFMSKNIQDDLPKIEKIKNSCQNAAIKILCHSPQILGNVSADTAHCEALVSLFYEEANKYCIFHFDETAEIDAMISDCEKLVDFGITPCIENFYVDKTRYGLVANMEKYLSFFDRISVKEIPVIPVLDFPRLFVEQFTNFHPIFLSELLIQKFTRKKIIIHAIDSVSPHQNREDWCAVGIGIVGWTDIFEYIKKQGVFAEYSVLEYENTYFINESIKNLKK